MNSHVRLSPTQAQIQVECSLGKHFIEQDIEKEIRESPVLTGKISQGIALLQQWHVKDYYDSKNQRLDAIRPKQFEHLVVSAFVCVAHCQYPETLVNIAGKFAESLRWSDRVPAVTTAAEILAVLCETDAFDIFKNGAQGSLMVQCNFTLSEELVQNILQAEYLPPMICEPEPITTNFQSGYLTVKDSVILRKYNQHSQCASLDVINARNAVPLSLDMDFVMSVPETPKNEPETVEAQQRWQQHVSTSKMVYRRMALAGNRFYMLNKYDKRGRMYVQGYHINPQGTAYKKACVDLADTEVVTGVPGI